MGNLFKEGSIFSFLGTSHGVTIAALTSIVILGIVLVSHVAGINALSFVSRASQWLLNLASKTIAKSETRYHRDLAIGKLDEKRKTVRIYRFLNDLTIDLGLKAAGTKPYELLFLCIVGSLLGTLICCQLLFGALWMTIILFPIVLVAVVCTLYTKANIAHDQRIEAVIEAENIICNNIKEGVVVAVRNNLHLMPTQVRDSFRDFLDNMEHKGYHIKTALQELNSDLGAVADDFIKKCIVFELEEEHGIADMFKDVVEINNIKMEMRTEMKRKFEEVTTQFCIGAGMIGLFLGGVLVLYKDVAHFYLKTPIGQIIICLDILIMLGEFVYITYLRANEL